MSISKSALELYFRCNKAYEYTYLDGFEGKYRPEEMKIGIAGHAILEDYFRAKRPDWSVVDDLRGDSQMKLSMLIGAYMQHHGVPAGVLQVEQSFKVGELKGVFDAVIRTAEGEVQIWDHKFTKSIITDDRYWDRYRVDFQAGLYTIAASELYPNDKVVFIINALRVPQLRQGKSETSSEYSARVDEHITDRPDEYFQQRRVIWSEDNLKQLERELDTLARDIPRQVYFPRSRNCFQYNRKCDFYPVCFEGKTVHDTDLYQLKVKR